MNDIHLARGESLTLVRREELNTPAAAHSCRLAATPRYFTPCQGQVLCQEIHGAEGRRTGYNTNTPSASAFPCLCSFGGCRKKLELGRNEELPGELTSRADREGVRVLNPCESIRKSKPSYMKCLVWTEPLPHSTGPILCCHPDLGLLPKLSKHWLWHSVCRKKDFPRQVLVTSEEWETGKTCT